MSMLVFSVATLCGLVGRYQCFGEVYFLHLQYVSQKRRYLPASPHGSYNLEDQHRNQTIKQVGLWLLQFWYCHAWYEGYVSAAKSMYRGINMGGLWTVNWILGQNFPERAEKTQDDPHHQNKRYTYCHYTVMWTVQCGVVVFLHFPVRTVGKPRYGLPAQIQVDSSEYKRNTSPLSWALSVG